MTTFTDDTKDRLRRERNIRLLRSVVTLFDLDITDRKDTGTIDARMSELERESVEVQDCFIDETTNFLNAKQADEDDAEADEYLERAQERMSKLRMDYLAREWKLAEEKLEDIDDVFMWGTPKLDCDEWTDDDLDALWVDLSDDEGTTYAQICVCVEDGVPEHGTLEASHDTDACCSIHHYAAVDDPELGDFTSPIDEDVTIRWEAADWGLDTFTDGALCKAIVDGVHQQICEHEEQVRLDRERREREEEWNNDEDEED